MKCRACKRDIPDNSIFCCWCGKEQKKDKTKVSVPKPTRLKSGDYSGQIMVDGERVRVVEHTETEYYAKAAGIKSGKIDVKPRPESITLAQAIEKYVSEKASLKNTSKQNYLYIKDNRFESLMKKKIGDITPDDLENARENELKKKSRKGGTISPDTVNDALRLCKTVLRKYTKEAFEVQDLEEQRKFPVVLTPEKIFPAIKGTDIELPCLLAMWLGMSASEIRGLTKSKSIRDGKLYIVETVVRVNGADERRAGGKESERPRCYDIPPYIRQLIDNVDGDIIEPRTAHAINQRLQTEIARAGLPHITFHSLRKTAASVMSSENIPTIIAQQRGGWKTDDTMKKVYMFAFENDRIEADKKIDSRFEKIISSSEKE